MRSVRPSRRPLRGLLRMRFFLNAITDYLILRSAPQKRVSKDAPALFQRLCACHGAPTPAIAQNLAVSMPLSCRDASPWPDARPLLHAPPPEILAGRRVLPAVEGLCNHQKCLLGVAQHGLPSCRALCRRNTSHPNNEEYKNKHSRRSTPHKSCTRLSLAAEFAIASEAATTSTISSGLIG